MSMYGYCKDDRVHTNIESVQHSAQSNVLLSLQIKSEVTFTHLRDTVSLLDANSSPEPNSLTKSIPDSDILNTTFCP